MKWIDLSKHSARLNAFQLPDGNTNLILSGVKQGGREWVAAEKIGFKPTRTHRNLYRPGTRVTMAEFAAIFPLAFSREFTHDEIFLKIRPTTEAQEDTNDLRAAIPVGLNYLGQEVFAGAAGRFIRNPDNTTIAEESANAPALFLRAAEGSASDLALCADGFVEAMARGRTMRAEDLRRFSAAVFGESGEMKPTDKRLRTVQEAVEAAIQRRVFKNHSVASPDAYRYAVKLLEHQPPLVARTSSSVANQQYSTPLPMSIAAQRILGDTSGKKVIEPTIGNGSLVMVLADGTEINGFEIDPNRADNAALLRPDLKVETGDFLGAPLEREFDCVISNPPFGGLEKTENFDGLRVTRLDHLIALKALDARKDEGRGVFIVGADRENIYPGKGGQIHGGSKTFLAWLADHYEIEDVIEMHGSLYAKQGAEYPVRMITVGRRRSSDEAKKAFKTEEFRIKGPIPVMRSWEELWEHVEELSERLHTKVPEPVAAVPADERVVNDYQAPYAPASSIGEPSAMIPRNLVAPVAFALSAFEEKYGQDVDSFVSARLAMDLDEMSEAFSPEQIDSMALAIKRFEEGRGFILGDMTGQGKGRVIAGLARYAIKNGIPVVFMSEKANLFSDFWRDLQDIGSEKLFTPLIMNADAKIVDHNTNQAIFQPTKRSALDAMMSADMSLAESEYNLMFCTYSQFNRNQNQSKKAAWLPALAKGALLVLDESHNAAGESNTAENIARAVAHSRACLYSSATFAKGAKSMAAYSKAFPDSISVAEIADTLEVGGEPLQEILSGLLAEDGAFIRREHDLSALKFQTVVDQSCLEQNEKASDQLAEILLAMSYVAGDVNRMVTRLNAAIKKDLEKLGDDQRKGNRMGVTSVNFGSRLYNVIRQFMLATKVDTTAEKAVKALQEGRKPVIVLEQTMETLLKETLFGLDRLEVEVSEDPIEAEGGEEQVAVKGMSGDGEEVDALDFRDLLYRLLERLSIITRRDAYGQSTQVHAMAEAENEEQARAFTDSIKHIRAMISRFPALPVSPIDSIREKIEQAGFSCGEISGRGIELRLSGNPIEKDGVTVVPGVAEGKVLVRSRVDNRTDTIYRFNNGRLDAVVLTRAGSTGLSLHASEKFMDQRQREMLELQIANNVAERIQFYGRVNRKGQICPPWITTIASGLPAEMRVLAMQNTKLRKLSANTQSNRNNAAEIKDVPDILNSLGNKIAKDFLENNPDIAATLDIDLETELEGDDHYFVNKLTGRLCLLPVESQRRILDELAVTFQNTILDLEAKGENPLRSNVYEWGAVETSRHLISGIERESYKSVFDKPVYLSRLEWEEDVSPIRSDKLATLVASGRQYLLQDNRVEFKKAQYNWEKDQVVCDGMLEQARERFDRVMECAKPVKFKTVKEALDDKDANAVKSAAARRNWLLANLNNLVPGKAIRFSGVDGVVYGVVTSLILPDPGREAQLGQYELRIAEPGAQRVISCTLNQLYTDENYASIYNDNHFGKNGRPVAEVFDEAPAGKLRRSRCVLTGNLYAAAEIAARASSGRAAVYSDDKGVRHRAIVLKSTIEQRDMLGAPIRLDTPEIVLRLAEKAIAKGKPMQVMTSSVFSEKHALALTIGRDAVSAVCPGTKDRGGRWFANKDFFAITGEWSGTREKMHVSFSASRLPAVLDQIKRMNDPLFVSSEYREMVGEVVREIEAAQEKKKPAPKRKEAA